MSKPVRRFDNRRLAMKSTWSDFMQSLLLVREFRVQRVFVIAALLLLCFFIALLYLDSRCDLSSWRGGVALRCAGHDPVRIWPWPPIAPWFEDPPLPDPFLPLTMNTRSAILKM